VARFDASVWGALSVRPRARRDGAADGTPFRFPGQYFDDEIGLAYNRYRFYDPEVGLYINADPVGLSGGIDGFVYARGRPFRVADPEGLDPVFATVSGHGITGRGASASARNGDPDLHPIVQQALPEQQNGMYPAGSRPPSTCAEPGAMSNYIRRWEAENNGGRPLDPDNPRDRNKIQRCLGDITSISAQHADGEARAPCPNCSQMLTNLRDRWGVPKERVIQPGASSQGGGDSVRTTPPVEGWR
jgi:RHS repeat-associated protein